MSGEAILSAENSEKSLGGQGSAPNHTGSSQRSPRSVMWSETVGLRTRPVRDQKIGLSLGLADFVLCCEIQSCHARRHNDLGGHSSFSSTSLVSLFCALNITTVEINSGVHLLKS